MHRIYIFVDKLISSLRQVELSHVLFQNRAYHNFQKIEKKKLFECQNLQIHNVAKYFKQNARIHHNAMNKRFNKN